MKSERARSFCSSAHPAGVAWTPPATSKTAAALRCAVHHSWILAPAPGTLGRMRLKLRRPPVARVDLLPSTSLHWPRQRTPPSCCGRARWIRRRRRSLPLRLGLRGSTSPTLRHRSTTLTTTLRLPLPKGRHLSYLASSAGAAGAGHVAGPNGGAVRQQPPRMVRRCAAPQPRQPRTRPACPPNQTKTASARCTVVDAGGALIGRGALYPQTWWVSASTVLQRIT